jgi:hypothetical protein
MAAHGRSDSAVVGLPLEACTPASDPFFLLVDVYRIPLSSSAVMAKEIKTRARSMEPVLEGIEIKHPLVKLTHPEQAS